MVIIQAFDKIDFMLSENKLNPMCRSIRGWEIEWSVKNGFTLLVPDLIGVGEMGPCIFTGDFYIWDISYSVWFTSLIIGRSIVEIRLLMWLDLPSCSEKETV
jgi:hypothetical protein